MDREVEFYDKPSAFEKLPGWVERWSGVSQWEIQRLKLSKYLNMVLMASHST